MQVRRIEPDELEAWIAALHVPFLETSSASEQAAFRRERTDFAKAWATFDGERIVGSLRSFDTRLTVPGGAQLETDAVTAVTVMPTHRRRGAMSQMIKTALTSAAERHETVSILIAAEYPIYGRFGYGPATEHVSYTVETQRARLVPAPVGSVEVVSAEAGRQEAQKVFDQFRLKQPGAIGRRDDSWDVDFGLIEAPGRPRWKGFCALYRSPEGVVEGYVQYHPESNWDNRVPRNKILVDELVTVTMSAYTELWRYLMTLDLVATLSANDRPVDEPLYWQLADARALRQAWRADFLWVRILDLVKALSARSYATDGRAVLEVVDPLGFAGGRVVLDGGTCRTTAESADVTLGIGALGAVYLGGQSLAVMHQAGMIDEHTPGAVAKLDAQLATRPAPWCNTWF